jgi:hypothetical protein
VSRPGGEADKFGNLYEGAWAIHHLLLVLAGRADALTLEDIGELGKGAEFTLLRYAETEVHQVKRQYRNANGWTPRTLEAEHILENAKHHVDRGRQFHFVSAIPAPKVAKLSDRARRSANLQSFVSTDWMTEGLRPDFTYLSGTVYASDEVAWKVLRSIWMHCQDEVGLRRMNDALAELLLEGAPPTLAALGLGDLAYRNQGVKLDTAAIESRLAEYGLRRAYRIGSATVTEAVAVTLDSWKASIERELLKPTIPRSEGRELAAALRAGSNQIVVIVGTAGAGKSAVLHQAVQELKTENWAVLGLRLDRLEAFASTAEIGQHLGLSMSPVAALAAVANERPSLLVIDQLDAVSLASGRMPLRFDAVADLIREAAAFPKMRVLLACRAFDVDNDHRIRQLVTDESVARLEVHRLSDDQISAAVQAMGLPANNLTTPQRSLLSLPLNLVLLSAIADQEDALAFTSATGLLNSYWERKRRDCANRCQPAPRFTPVIAALADAMSARQQLTTSVSVLDEGDLGTDAEVLASEHVLVRDGQRYAFFHEAFFDYAFARLWVNRDQSLVEFLLGDEQELFRRAQVRQILLYLRDDDPARFVREAEAVLAHPKVRFHIKAVVLALLRSLPDPSTADWQMIQRLMGPEGPVATNLWLTVRTPPWFDRMDAEGAIAGWLATEDDAVRAQVMDVLLGAIKERPDRMAELIAPYAGTTAQYPNWLAWITRFANVHESRALFELVLDAVRRGDYNDREQALWMAVFGLGEHQPTWAVELLRTWLADRTGGLDLDANDQVTALRVTEHSLVELARHAADQAPLQFCQALVPYMLRVMSLTEGDTTQRPVSDRHFSFRQQGSGPMPGLDDALLHEAATALRKLVEQESPEVQPILEQLARDQHDSAQWLLYEALRADGSRYADWSAELLLEGDHRFYSGYMSDSHWTARQLLQATSPHMSDEHFRRVEAAVMNLRPEWEGRKQAGWASFELLSAMAEARLSDAARRRLGELRRRFGQDQPPEPRDVVGGAIGSPIPETAVKRMNDDQWLRAMDKHRTDREDFETLKGGVHELSQLLATEAANDPTRFARLALRLTPDTPPEYGNAILQALGQTDEPVESALVFDAMRHIAAFSNAENDQWLGMPLRRQLVSEVPDDIIELILDRALHSPNPTGDVWSTQASSGQYFYNGDILSNGINTARGEAATILGDLIVHDADGHRTRLVAPSLGQLAGDPSVAVRSCVAHLLGACLRHANAEAIAAFEPLIQADDRLLATRYVMRLAIGIGMSKPHVVEPVIRRMLASADATVREAGGQLAAYAGLELGLAQLLTAARESTDASTRKGAADLCAQTLAHTTDAPTAAEALHQFIADREEDVRKAAAQVAGSLRNRELRPYSELLTALIASEAFTEALPQLLITLQAAPDRIDDIVLACARRFIDLYGEEAGDMSKAAAGEAREVVQLTLRAYAQASDRDMRRQVLDLIDGLLLINAIGALEAVDATER